MKPSLPVCTNIDVPITEVVNHHPRFLVLRCNVRPKKYPSHVLWVIGLGCCLFIGFTAIHATTVVAVRTPTFILIGIDSRVIASDIKTGHEIPELGCKIMQVGDISIASAGLFAGGNKKLFNGYELAKQASLKGGGAIAVADRFAKLANKTIY